MSAVSLPRRGSRRAPRIAGFAPLLVSLFVGAVAFGLSLLVTALMGYAPGDVASGFIDGAFGSQEQISGTVMTMIPLVLLGLAWILATSARQINLGLEGQILAGGIAATIVGTNFDGLAQPLHVALSVLAGAAGGALWAGLPALMYVRRDVSVLLSSFMLNFVALLLVGWLIRGPMQNPEGLGLIESRPVALSAQWPLLGGTTMHWDVLLIPVAVLALLFVQRATTIGFRLRLIGANEEAARHAGIATKRIGAVALMTSGAIAGIAGSSLILGSFTGSMTEGFSSGYGFIGIAVALLARNNPLGCVVSALMFAALQQGGALVETRVGVPSASIDLTQGLVILLMAGSGWLLVMLTRRRSAATLIPERADGTV